MKKLLFVFAALLLIASGVAAVSAYEAHLINVKAHVENALFVQTEELDFGTVFPEEWRVEHRTISLSGSAEDELGTGAAGDLLNVIFNVYAEWKPLPAGSNILTDTPGFYNWMGYFTYVDFDTDGLATQMDGPVNPPDGNPGDVAVKIAGPFTLESATPRLLYVGIDVPVFDGFYNAITDALWQDEFNTTKPSGWSEPTYTILAADYPVSFDADGMDFGLDLKIQVVDINRVTGTGL